MGRSDKRDPKLSEVKAVLQRLQGFTESESAGSQPTTHDLGAGRRTGLATAAILLFTATGIFGVAVYVGVSLNGPAARSQPEPTNPPGQTAAVTPSPDKESPPVAPRRQLDPSKAPAVKAALESARSLMAKGRVRAAREQLAALASEGSADAAWDLARSFDPNVLASIPGTDAAPDINEATRWYREWYAVAVQEGLVADSVSLERIIGSMRQ
jgi:hypothetical protein